jgi:trehalose/maltose transport system substrate-binding protein
VVEWLASSGAGSIDEPDGTVSIDSREAARAIARAAGWVNTISPPGVTTYKEEEARHVFHTGQAAFMRNWPYAYTLMQAEDSAVRGKFDVCVLPGEKGEHAAALGGWQLSVSAYSAHREEAIELVKFLSSPEAQKARALDASLLPSRTRLYDDPEIAAAIPFFPAMQEVFTNAAPRPSTVTGEDYNQVSTIVFQNVNRVLSGQTNAETAVAKMGTELEKVMKRSR